MSQADEDEGGKYFISDEAWLLFPCVDKLFVCVIISDCY